MPQGTVPPFLASSAQPTRDLTHRSTGNFQLHSPHGASGKSSSQRCTAALGPSTAVSFAATSAKNFWGTVGREGLKVRCRNRLCEHKSLQPDPHAPLSCGVGCAAASQSGVCAASGRGFSGSSGPCRNPRSSDQGCRRVRKESAGREEEMSCYSMLQENL